MTLPNSFSGKDRTKKTNLGVSAAFGQKVGSLLRTPWLAMPASKKGFDELAI
jgi:hypothetical protein